MLSSGCRDIYYFKSVARRFMEMMRHVYSPSVADFHNLSLQPIEYQPVLLSPHGSETKQSSYIQHSSGSFVPDHRRVLSHRDTVLLFMFSTRAGEIGGCTYENEVQSETTSINRSEGCLLAP